jgi:RimJ/RimL family protein N-acetyltransferase
MEPVEISAGRLHLRPFDSGDAEAVHLACQDQDIQRFTSIPSPYREEDAREYVESTCPSGWATGRFAAFAVVDSVSAELLAHVSLARIGLVDPFAADIGYWCAPWARRRGVATQAVQAVCRWGLGGLGLRRIGWRAEVGNTAARRTAEKAGFTMDGIVRGVLTRRGARVDAWVGSLREEG